jgi:hypothetical protein
MCVIVDTNVMHAFFRQSATNDFTPVYDWVDTGKGRIVYGGSTQEREIARIKYALRQMVNWSRAGKARRLPRPEVDSAAMQLDSSHSCRSNDSHCIALARLSGARLICTRDGLLSSDFKNPALISSPRGRVFREPRHRHLLRMNGKCDANACTASRSCAQQSGRRARHRH